MRFFVSIGGCLLTLALCSTTPAFAKTILPDACGDEKIKFDVKTGNSDAPIGAPADGKAQIVFIQTMDREGLFIGNPSTRFGVDGTWAGGNHGNSYFVFPIAPGEHHLCVNWQGTKKSGALPITIEAGKTYYFEATITLQQRSSRGYSNGQSVTMSHTDRGFEYAFLNEDEGKFRVKASKLSTSSKQP